MGCGNNDAVGSARGGGGVGEAGCGGWCAGVGLWWARRGRRGGGGGTLRGGRRKNYGGGLAKGHISINANGNAGAKGAHNRCGRYRRGLLIAAVASKRISGRNNIVVVLIIIFISSGAASPSQGLPELLLLLSVEHLNGAVWVEHKTRGAGAHLRWVPRRRVGAVDNHLSKFAVIVEQHDAGAADARRGAQRKRRHALWGLEGGGIDAAADKVWVGRWLVLGQRYSVLHGRWGASGTLGGTCRGVGGAGSTNGGGARGAAEAVVGSEAVGAAGGHRAAAVRRWASAAAAAHRRLGRHGARIHINRCFSAAVGAEAHRRHLLLVEGVEG